MMFQSVSEHFANLWHAKRGKTCVEGPNALFRGTDVAKMVSQRNQPFYRIRPEMMFECFGAFHKPSARQKRQNLCFGLNALFQGTEVAKLVSQRNQPFHLIIAQTMFESVSRILQTFGMSKVAKVVFRT